MPFTCPGASSVHPDYLTFETAAVHEMITVCIPCPLSELGPSHSRSSTRAERMARACLRYGSRPKGWEPNQASLTKDLFANWLPHKTRAILSTVPSSHILPIP